MHNWEHYGRLPAYLLMATLVASCGGGDGDTLIGQSSDKIELASGASTIVAPISGAVDISFHASHDGAPVKQQLVTVSIISGEAGLLDGASGVVKVLQLQTDNSGNASFKLRGLATSSVGQILISYVDSNNLKTSKVISYQVGSNLNLVYDLSLAPVVGSDNTIATVGADSLVNIVATLKNKLNLPIANQTVSFTTSIGTLASAVATTNALGQAVVQLSGVGANAGIGIVNVAFTDADGNQAANKMSVEVVNDFTVQLSVANNNVLTGTSDIPLNAFILDATGTTVSSAADVKARFEIVSGGGSISNISGLQDGIVTAKYTLPKDAKNQTVKLRVVLSGTGISTTNAPEALIDLNLSGTQVAITSSKVNVSEGETVDLNLSLKNGQGVGLSGQQLNLTGSGLVFSAPSVITGADGSAKISAVVATNGSNSATATVAVANANMNVGAMSISLAVSQLSFDIQTPTNAPLPINVPHTMTVSLKDATAVDGRKVKVSSTLGVLDGNANAAVTTLTIVDPTPTDSVFSGTAVFTLNAPFPGEALVQAVAQTAVGAASPFALETAKFVSLVSTTPSKLTIQAAKTNLTASESTVLTAKVLDDKDNPVAGVEVGFRRDKDPSNGSLSDALVTTDNNGIAKVTFTAGAITTAFNAIEISSTLASNPTNIAPSVQQLTVGGQALFVSIGTGNVIGELGSAASTTYVLPHQVIVTDSTGAPSINKDVTLSIIPLAYYKGVYALPLIGSSWVANRYASCVNEDANQNGITELLENNGVGSNVFGSADVVDNKDGLLWPGSPVTLSAKTVRTDVNGVATFDVIYGKSYANWLLVKLIATTPVGGSETKAERTFTTVASTPDLRTTNSPPGGIVSPFGSVQSSDIKTFTDPSTGVTSFVTDESGFPCTYRYFPAQ